MDISRTLTNYTRYTHFVFGGVENGQMTLYVMAKFSRIDKKKLFFAFTLQEENYIPSYNAMTVVKRFDAFFSFTVIKNQIYLNTLILRNVFLYIKA